MDEKFSSFLTRQETRALQSMYELWTTTIKADVLGSRLFGENLISRYEIEKFNSLPTPYEKSSYIFHNVLMKATYDDIENIRRILLQTNIGSHKNLAKLLPRRKVHDNYDFDAYDDQVPKQSNNSMEIGDVNDKKHQDDDDTGKGKNKDDELGITVFDEGEYVSIHLPEGSLPSSILSDSVAQNAAVSNKRKRGPQVIRVKKSNYDPGLAKPTANCDPRHYNKRFKPALECYKTKPQNKKDPHFQHRKKCGKGLCVIFRNFSEDLEGYKVDEAKIKEFFENTLHFEVWSDNQNLKLADLTKKEFQQALKDVQSYLANKFSSHDVDRFFMFVLSHGDEDGIKFCKQGSKQEEEVGEDGKATRMTVEDIVKMFGHDEVPLLKGFPKCFMIQACQGTEIAKPAAGAEKKEYIEKMDIDNMADRLSNLWKPPQIPVAAGTDVLICLPSQKGKYAYVLPHSGSYFIQTILQQFQDLYDKEHLLDIMVHVNKVFFGKKIPAEVDGSKVTTFQVPTLSCTLTKKFFLSIPDHYNDSDED